MVVERATDASPLISVIIVAHAPHPFLRGAVDSVLEQSLPRAAFEVLVAKNFREPGLDSYLESVGVRDLYVPEPSGAPKIAAGIRASRGRVITFLDYDDAYDSQRLASLRDVFAHEPDLAFYHNGLGYIGPDGRSLDPSLDRSLRLPRLRAGSPIVLAGPGKVRASGRLAGRLPDFNSSSCAVRRDVAEHAVPYLERMYICADTLLFFAGLVADGSLRVDSRPLTHYRVHADNSTAAGGGDLERQRQKLLEFARRCAEDYRQVREFVSAAGVPDALRVVDARIWVNRLTIAYRAESTGRREFLRLLGELPGFLGTFPVQEDLFAILGMPAFLASPTLGRRLYQRQMAVR